MQTAIILIVGAMAITLTGFSWYRNIELLQKRIKNKDLTSSDMYVDYPIRLVWLLYITVFSFGFVINNLF
ncbi:MAG: hypothetical protein A2248_16320 [Candidatus Raymondbacteria bacterium RIFOXYA2_FULL_49_16]|uniref:Uncharacterized protein n=1 Tax=Candidatus Raymondbacteria bacterium RIFOXYD12_FULL_49_13 TaxID=1817890 RepID=A0A1F7F4I4_UNCRA|nr:MAG: hypothetical protein A2248_16320 [Candidatus Raymondbacteria bacterium RIFOXYA2_FULL_49_16]OGK01447.1 MAG: hypothetical protein A2519_19160 [Candidatus Raymondbacteria bacterium RIFOXYD12_FULL_49_13]OGP42707.1 MAG: hypothetical protein A2324_00735 [Candidatus Raymondbacteria bacterium RIFOXYB2_FULL_49_35]